MFEQLTREIKASMGIYEAREDRVYGVMAEFSDPGELMHAAEAAREEGYEHDDVHSPVPIHGMDKAMGLTNSKVGYPTLVGGITGLLIGLWLQWWTAAVDYPINVGGMPLFATEPSTPIMFELTILFAAFGAVVGMLALNGLPRPYSPLFYSRNFARVTDDKFFLHVAASDSMFDMDETKSFLDSIGGYNIEVIEDHEEPEVEEDDAA